MGANSFKEYQWAFSVFITLESRLLNNTIINMANRKISGIRITECNGSDSKMSSVTTLVPIFRKLIVAEA